MNVLEESIRLNDSKEALTETFIKDFKLTQVKQDGKAVKITIPYKEKTPFPPAMQTCILNPETNILTVSSMIYANTDTVIDKDSLTISVRKDLLYTTVFFYNYITPSKYADKYYMYQLEFDYGGFNVDKNSEIITYLKNLDPETSRGTVTTVKRPMGNS